LIFAPTQLRVLGLAYTWSCHKPRVTLSQSWLGSSGKNRAQLL
jgi:hypothetical protein